MKHLDKMVKLNKIINIACENGTLTHLVRCSKAMKVPYLRAVIQESLRLFPPFVVQMPRYAPTAGFQVSGFHIPV
jgi:cytochrome P450